MSDNIFYFNSDQTLDPAWDGGKLIFNPPNNVVIHIPVSVMETLPNNWTCSIYRDGGKGNIGFDKDDGIYIKARVNYPETSGDGSVIHIEKISTNTMWVHGDIQNSY